MDQSGSIMVIVIHGWRISAWLVETGGWLSRMRLWSRSKLNLPCSLRPSNVVSADIWPASIFKCGHKHLPCSLAFTCASIDTDWLFFSFSNVFKVTEINRQVRQLWGWGLPPSSTRRSLPSDVNLACNEYLSKAGYCSSASVLSILLL